MITINGITFRNLEEQVAYLSENFPYFTIEGTEIVIKKEDGTEIARINQAGVSSINVSTSSDITTITQTFNDGTSSSFTIDMTSYLKKNTTITTKEQAYIKNPDGTQGTETIDDQASNSTIVKRTSTGRINSVDPQYDGNVATKKYVDDAVAKYKHFIELTFVDGCSEELKGFVILENKSNIPYTASTFKDLFTKEITVNGGSSTWNIIPSITSQYFELYGNDRPAPCLYYYDDQTDIFDNNTYPDGGYSSGLTLQSLTDSVSTL